MAQFLENALSDELSAGAVSQSAVHTAPDQQMASGTQRPRSDSPLRTGKAPRISRLQNLIVVVLLVALIAGITTSFWRLNRITNELNQYFPLQGAALQPTFRTSRF